MFPFKDENPTELAAIVTVGLLIANIAAWVLVQGMGANLQPSVCEFGLIPAEVTGRAAQGPDICSFGGLTWGAAFTSMFMHGGWLHLISNMMFLWVFGDNVEDAMGHRRFLFFFLICGATGALAHGMIQPNSTVPLVGASGAISGVLGAYFVLHPRIRVWVLMFSAIPMRLPTWLVIGGWIALNVLNATYGDAGESGVAWWAHVGGFAAGVLLIPFFKMAHVPLLDMTKAGTGGLRRNGDR